MAGTSTTSYSVHSNAGYKTFGYLKSAKVYAQAEANRTGVSVGIYQNDGRGKTWSIRPKKQKNPFGLFKNYYVTVDGKKFGPYKTKAKAQKVGVVMARVLDKPAHILGEAKKKSNPVCRHVSRNVTSKRRR